MTTQPTRQDWIVADEFANMVELLFASHPAKARTLIATLAASSPETVEQARNALKDQALLLRDAA